jgi:cytochrome c oxidase subunit 3
MTSAVESLTHQIYNRRLGLWLYILSDSVVFLAFLAARYYILGTSRPPEVNQVLGLFLTCMLLVSSFFANRADVAIAYDDRPAFVRSLAVTLILGAAFLLIVVLVEWPEALRFAPPGTPFGTALFSLTGLHAVHVLSGLIVLLVALFKGRRGSYTQDHWGAEGAIIYWHFVDVVWVFVYITLYLVR